jgi:hypothetical protein
MSEWAEGFAAGAAVALWVVALALRAMSWYLKRLAK